MNEPHARPSESAEMYPDTSRLRAMLAELHGVKEDQVLPTAGADQALDAACRAAVGGAALILAPDFPRYLHHSTNAGHAVVTVKIGDYPFAFPAGALLAAAAPATTLIIVSTVGNPTGVRPPTGLFEELRRRAPRALLVIDEVYSPFTGDDYCMFAATKSDVISVRSLSKIGFPGLRVGYAVGSAETLRALGRFVSPFAIATASVERAVGVVRMHGSWSGTIKRQVAARDWLADELAGRGVKVSASPGNWLLAYFGAETADVTASLKEGGVLVQPQSAPELKGWLRISTPDLESVSALLGALETITVRRS
ncbi:MAG TPA: aminotransferase class I/II-fold pyridoxal phosphate-dependent enzyme [Pyrinomonadaceae bacterium]|nr:aminotransferase class I/II-fold pyridoxal phosphate-dependent enzyme [Pyrinomonadaceae bacterium]